MVGDGGMVIALEKRGYVQGGAWCTEAAVEHPEAGEAPGRARVGGGGSQPPASTSLQNEILLVLNMEATFCNSEDA